MGKHLVKATCYDKRGRVISQAVNSYRKTHPLMAHFAKLSGRPDAVYLHAEVAALLKCSDDRPPHHIKIERYKKDGSPGLAKPCPACELAIKAWGVKLVTYTMD
jgi:deoxycytidylate deaminase